MYKVTSRILQQCYNHVPNYVILIVVCVTVLYNIHVHILAYMNLNRNSHIKGTILIHKQYENFPVSEMVDLESTMSYV